MRRVLELLATVFVVILIGLLAWNHRRAVPISAIPLPPATSQPPDTHIEYAEETQAREMVTIAGPLADYVSQHSSNQSAEAVTHPIPVRRMVASDLAANSTSGSSQSILHTTFPLSNATNLSFEIPAHASTPQLHGTYSSFIHQDGDYSDDDAEVEFLLLDEQQFSAFLRQRPIDELFSASGSRNQEVNFTLPPTFDKPKKYYLVFRNGSNAQKKLAVEADFRLDF